MELSLYEFHQLFVTIYDVVLDLIGRDFAKELAGAVDLALLDFPEVHGRRPFVCGIREDIVLDVPTPLDGLAEILFRFLLGEDVQRMVVLHRVLSEILHNDGGFLLVDQPGSFHHEILRIHSVLAENRDVDAL